MKSLTYFSKYTKNGGDGSDESASASNGGLDIQSLRDTMDEENRRTSTLPTTTASSGDSGDYEVASGSASQQDEHQHLQES